MIKRKGKLPSLKKQHSADTEYTRNACYFPNIGGIQKVFLKQLTFECKVKNVHSCVPNQADPSYREPLLVWVSPSALLINFIYQARQPLPWYFN
jgi:hypothetical protein